MFCEINNKNKIYLLGLKMKKIKSAYKYPMQSSELNICEVSKTNERVLITAESLKNKMLLLSFNVSKNKTNKYFVIPFLH